MEILIAIGVFLTILFLMLWYLDRRTNRRRRGLPPSHEPERAIGQEQYGVPRGVDPQSMGDWGQSGGAPSGGGGPAPGGP